MLLQSRRSLQTSGEQLHPFVLKPEYLALVVSCLPLYCEMGVGGENDERFLYSKPNNQNIHSSLLIPTELDALAKGTSFLWR